MDWYPHGSSASLGKRLKRYLNKRTQSKFAVKITLRHQNVMTLRPIFYVCFFANAAHIVLLEMFPVAKLHEFYCCSLLNLATWNAFMCFSAN